MSEKYLSDEELENVVIKARMATSRQSHIDYLTGSQIAQYTMDFRHRAIANAASDKGYAAGDSERDALRAEVDRYKVVLEWMVHPSWCDNCPLPESWRLQCGAGNCREVLAQWALSEAGK